MLVFEVSERLGFLTRSNLGTRGFISCAAADGKSDNKIDNNGVTGLHNSYPNVIAALKVLLELVYL